MAYMSQEGYDKLVAELQYLESVERPKASKRRSVILRHVLLR